MTATFTLRDPQDHYVWGQWVLDAEQVQRLTVGQLAAVVPVSCDFLADYFGYECEHREATA